MRLMKSTAPSAKPTRMPSVRSRKIVSRKVASSGADQEREFAPVRHIPGDDRQHGRQRSQRNEAGERSRDQHEQQKEQRMQHAGDRAARTGADVGRGSGDGAGDADAAEQRRADIGKALRNQFTIRPMPSSSHPVGHHRRQQRFDGAEQRKCDCIRQNRLRLCNRQ